jgi:2,3,4,5-tetrahydropyridine-2-carboxylate N-succinyltransferase
MLKQVQMNLSNLQNIIEESWNNKSELSAKSAPKEILSAISQVLSLCEQGVLRVAEPTNNGWQVNQWVKKAILLHFATQQNRVMPTGLSNAFDKVNVRFNQYTQQDFEQLQFRVVPPATIREGTFVGKNAVVMPSYINIGAYVGSGTMVDTWATIGSCAQIGNNVHISGGAGIGGILEPLQAQPTIIEDNCFIGARSEIVEGVIVEKNSVISMGVFIGQSTKIYNRETGEVTYGRIPSGSVVVPGTLPAKNGEYALQAAIIVKQVDAKTLAKVGINQILREAQ